MSANVIATDLPPAVLKRKIIRYALGIVLVIAIAFGVNWPASFLAVVLANSFLLGHRPSFKQGLDFLIKVAIAVAVALFLSNYLLQYRELYIVLIGLILFYLFYAKDSLISPLLKTWFLLASLIIPIMSLKSIMIGEIVAWSIIIGTVVSLLVVWSVFALFPDKEDSYPPTKKSPLPDLNSPSDYDRFIAALKRTLVVYPVIITFFMFDFQSDVLILIYIGLYSSFPGFAKDFSVGKLLLIGCITGGIISFLIYELLVLVPMFFFLLLLFFGVALLIGNEILGGGKYAAQIKAGFSTIVIILGSAVGTNEVDAGGKMLLRVIQIIIVVIYLVIAFGIIEKMFPAKEPSVEQ